MASETKVQFTKDPRRALQFQWKCDAERAAKEIGWARKDAQSVSVMGFKLWVIADDHGNMLTKDAYEYLKNLRVQAGAR